jgi:hypothetical protein
MPNTCKIINPLVPKAIFLSISVKLSGMPYCGLKRIPIFCFFEKIKNKKVFFSGSLVPSRPVHKVPPGHIIPSRNVHFKPDTQFHHWLSLKVPLNSFFLQPT